MTKLILVAAPSGAGKSSFVDRICKEEPRLCDVVTYTTRTIRPGEVDGRQYHFISHDEFERRAQEDFFVEQAHVHTNRYGTSWKSLQDVWAGGRWAIMDIDVQGTKTFRSKFPDAKTIFILPPSIDELRRRILKRDAKPPADLEIRMKNAEREMALAPTYDVRIVNDDFNHAFSQFKKTIEEWLGPR